MIDFLSKCLDVLMQALAAIGAYWLAKDRARAEGLSRKLEMQNDIAKAARDGPRDQSDAAGRLRDGTF